MKKVNKSWNNEKNLDSSGIYKVSYHNGSCLFFLKKRKLQSLKFHMSN